jgi:pimeloyl-ACP methyl ester carboxylesterase
MTDLPPILFLHGLVTSSQRTWGDNGWFDLVREANREVLAVDLPGHGTEYYPTDDFNGDLYNAVESQIIHDAVDAITFSLGAKIVLNLAVRNPSRFRKIVVSGVGDSLFTPDHERGHRIFQAIAGKPITDDPESQYFAQLADSPEVNRTLISQYMSKQNTILTADQLHEINVPVLVVLGENDFSGPATKLIDALPKAELVTLKGVDHFATPKNFKFIDTALAFLDAVPSW